jgi:hypothetical protein
MKSNLFLEGKSLFVASRRRFLVAIHQQFKSVGEGKSRSFMSSTSDCLLGQSTAQLRHTA